VSPSPSLPLCPPHRLSHCLSPTSSDYCAHQQDDAPLYIFDAHLATRTFADGGSLRAECGPPPACFSHDAMAGIHHLRPLPPAWLLVAAARSGTPIHDHPHTGAHPEPNPNPVLTTSPTLPLYADPEPEPAVAWNVLLSGCKLWAILPPGECELAEDQGSALGWFMRHGAALPEGAVVVVQVRALHCLHWSFTLGCIPTAWAGCVSCCLALVLALTHAHAENSPGQWAC
jgi:hypothetical protein